MIKTEHICRFKVTGRDGRSKGDHTFHNFAFGAGLDLVASFFTGGSAPAPYYLGLLGASFGGYARVNDTEAGHINPVSGFFLPTGGGWAESTVNIDGFPYSVDPPSPVPRQAWSPTLSAWDGGAGDRGFQVEGSASWTCTAFYRPPLGATDAAQFLFYISQGCILFGGPGADEVEFAYENPGFLGFDEDVVFPSTNPLFIAIGPYYYATDALQEEAGTPEPSGTTGYLAPGDTIDITYKIRFSVEDLDY